MYKNWQIAKSALENEETSEQAQQEYSKVAQWCCDGQEYRIVEDGDYYKVEPFSEEHWKIVANFVKSAVRLGQNMLLTPIHTPPLDTYVGGERTTVQLIDVRLDNGEYSFNFDGLKRWIKMCLDCGIEYFEMAHLYSQWGATCAPKIMATVDGEYRRLFGWETPALGGEYGKYLSKMKLS